MTLKTYLEEHHVTGDKLLAKVRELVHEGNVRRVIIKNADGRAIMELPLTVGVVGAVLLPVWVAIGAVAALAADYRIAVEKNGVTKKARAEPRELAATGAKAEAEIC
jgi:hypothetical protein